jgi:hypothetical protein
MERVAFLIEDTGERLACMLNPEGLVLRRTAGVRPARSLQGQVTGAGLSDDPLLYTGGGQTELQLDLLFDVRLPGSSTTAVDVRELTAPLWQLAENADRADRYGRPPLARFVWGKAWNILGVVTAVAERFEQFTPAGEPQRSWLRLRFVRVSDQAPPGTDVSGGVSPATLDRLLEELPETPPVALAATTELAGVHTVTGEGTTGENLPLVIAGYGLDPSLWPLVAWFNDIADPLRLAAGTILRIPALSLLERLGR